MSRKPYPSDLTAQWQVLPHDLPPWGTVWWYFRTWRRDGTWEQFHDALRPLVRRGTGHAPISGAAVIDSQAVKSTEKWVPGL